MIPENPHPASETAPAGLPDPDLRLSFSRRPRRNRATPAMRALVRETRLSPENLILPLFVTEGKSQSLPIASMPGVFRRSPDLLVSTAREAAGLGIPAVALFPALESAKKDPFGKEALNPDGLLQRTVKALKDALPGLLVITDVALDPYSSDGHDGYVRRHGGDLEIVNDVTVELLGRMAVAQAEAGADMVAPSDMMDGRVGHIRRALDAAGREKTAILSYAVKYASAFYGPFRDALDSAPRGGDKKTYQMDPANSREALREVLLDAEEGADMVMVKPALAYLDIIAKVKEAVPLPVAAYQVSGEYAMIKAAAEKGWLDGDRVLLESLLSIKRAGADIILTYAALEAARALG